MYMYMLVYTLIILAIILCLSYTIPIVKSVTRSHQFGGNHTVLRAPANSESNTVIVVSLFTRDSLIKGWIFNAKATGALALCTFRKNDSGIYTIINETDHQVTKVGKHEIHLQGLSQLPVEPGDYYGFRSVGKNIVAAVPNADTVVTMINSTQILSTGSSLNRGQVVKGLKYIFRPIITGIFIAADDGKLGSRQRPAISAQHILQFYKGNNLGTPENGVYWVSHTGISGASEVYCNFSLHNGHGYMLVGAVGVGNKWPNFNSGRYPFSPGFKFGQYDKYGRSGTYYMKWSKFDRGSISDNNTVRCKHGGYYYNDKGKYCGDTSGKGGITDIMLATANNKYWVVIDRSHLNCNYDKTVIPLTSSNNFKGSCNPNKNVHIKTKINKSKVRSGEPCINMGSSHACGKNYMFWGEDDFHAKEQFKNENGGVMVYIGGS